MSSQDMLAPSRGRFVFDIETDNLLEKVSVVHCAVMLDLDTEEMFDFGPQDGDEPATYPLSKFFEMYQSANTLIGHNIIGYDLAVLDKLHGLKPSPDCEIIDTLNLGRLVFSDIKQTDFPMASAYKKWKLLRDAHEARQAEQAEADPFNEANDTAPFTLPAPHEFPGQFVGLHSLEAWGYRMGAERKGDYSKECKAAGIDPWAQWSPAMHEYMKQDATVNVQLYNHLMSFDPSPQSVRLEMRVQLLCSQMERNGWPFDRKGAEALYSELTSEREAMAQKLRDLFPPWTVQFDDFIPKRPNKTKGYLVGVPVPRFEEIEFNPNSRAHIELKLREKYAWVPTEFTPSGKATIDDDVLQALPFPEAKQLAKLFMIAKRIGQISEGDKAWLRYVTPEGKIHGRYSTNGCVTGRASHYNPNIGQVPSVGKPYGRQCRALFGVPTGWRQLGADQAGLELRCLGSFMAAFDGGKYIETVLYGDIHWENAKAIFAQPDDLVLDKEDKQHKKWRDLAKTIIYAMLYGSGDANLGSIVGKGRKAGVTIRARLMGKFPALNALVKFVKKAAKKGWLKGLDGRKIPVRSEHAALNSLLQSAGSIICKQWIVDAEEALKDAGLKHGWDGDFVFLGWVHDEVQLAVKDGVDIEMVARLVKEAGRNMESIFPSWKCPTDVDTKIGMNWATCH